MGQLQKYAANHRLRDAREAKGWSQEQLAEHLGTSAMMIYRWEHGRAFPGPYYRQKLHVLFDQSAVALGLVPSNDTPLVTDVLDSSLPLPKAMPPFNARVGGLIGRHALLSTLKQKLLQVPTASPLAISGLPGIGKTALAVELAYIPELQERYSDGILWAGLGLHPNLPAILNMWGTAIGLSSSELAKLATVEELCRALHAAIGTRQLLFIIDDAWNIQDVLNLKVGGPACAYIMTTRSFAIATQFAPDTRFVVPELSMHASMELLQQLAPEPLEKEPELIRDLAQSVGSLPLALTLIGHHLHQIAATKQDRRIKQALERLQQKEARLRLTMPLAPIEQPAYLSLGTSFSLHAAIAVSEQVLHEDAQYLLHALALFPPKPNSFSEDIALAVSGMSPDQFYMHIDTLVDVGLLESIGDARYSLHQTIADYALPDHDLAAERRLEEVWIAYFTQHTYDLGAFHDEVQNILAALRLAHEQQHEQAFMQLAMLTASYLRLRGASNEVEHILRDALEIAKTVNDTSMHISLLSKLAIHVLNTGTIYATITLAEQGIALTTQYMRLDLQGQFYSFLGQAYIYLGEYQQAQTALEAGVVVADESGDRVSMSQLLWKLSGIAQRHDLRRAEHYSLQALSQARAINNMVNISASLQQLAVIAGKSGDYSLSETYSLESLAISRQIGDAGLSGSNLANLAMAAHEQGNFTQAQIYLQEALILARKTQQPASICGILSTLGTLSISLQQFAEAEGYLREGLTIARNVGYKEQQVIMLFNLGEAAMKQADYDRATTVLQEGLLLAQHIVDARHIGAFLAKLAEIFFLEQRYEEGIRTAEAGLHDASTAQYLPERGALLFILARLNYQFGNSALGRAQGEESLTIFTSLGHQQRAAVSAWLVDHA